MMNNERIQEAERALDGITVAFPGLREEIAPSIVTTVNALRFTARYRQWRDDDGWHADITVFHKRGFILMQATPDVDYWTKKNIKRVAQEAYKNYKNYKGEK